MIRTVHCLLKLVGSLFLINRHHQHVIPIISRSFHVIISTFELAISAISQSTRSPSGFHYFAKNFEKIFAKYIGHRGLSVCLSVCLFVCCLSVFKGSTGRTECPIVLIFLQKMSSGHATMQNFFFWKSDEGQGQGHHFCENQIMGHNFWTGSDRDFGLVAKRSLYNSASVKYPPFWRTPSRFYVTWL